MQMVDLIGQYKNISSEIDNAILEVVRSGAYINGPQVSQFANHLTEYLDVKHVIPCGNGTDALQIALMSLQLNVGDEVIVPSFSYIAAAEAVLLLGLKPVFVDVQKDIFNIDFSKIEEAISPKTRAIVVVHLFGQSCDMGPIEAIAQQYNLCIIEDNAQSIGSTYKYSDGRIRKTGTIGRIGCLSFFPSKNLGCFGDGGAILTNDDALAASIRMIANHGQKQKYYHETIGVNSRLDTLQAAILDVKLSYLDAFNLARKNAANLYDQLLSDCSQVVCPKRSDFSDHVFHQYTLQVAPEHRDGLVKYLSVNNIPSMIYYPLSLHEQKVFETNCRIGGDLSVSKHLSQTVLSLPMHTEMTEEMQIKICDVVKSFFKSL